MIIDELFSQEDNKVMNIFENKTSYYKLHNDDNDTDDLRMKTLRLSVKESLTPENLPRRLVLNLLICSWGAAQNWQAAGTRQGSNGRSLHGVDEGQAVGQLKGHDLSINSAERCQKRVDISYNLCIHSGNVWNLFQGSSCAASVKDIK